MLLPAEKLAAAKRAGRLVFVVSSNSGYICRVCLIQSQKFFSPHCGHCRAMAPAWEAVKYRFKRTLLSIDCTADREVCQQHKVLGYPDLRLLRDKVHEVYTGKRNEDSVRQDQARLCNEKLIFSCFCFI